MFLLRGLPKEKINDNNSLNLKKSLLFKWLEIAAERKKER
jgi:hypothetical protein